LSIPIRKNGEEQYIAGKIDKEKSRNGKKPLNFFDTLELFLYKTAAI